MMYKREREDLVDSLRRKGIRDESVLDAVLNVERHVFIPGVMKHHAYKDVALPIGYGQTISQPYTVAFMTQSLNLAPASTVLEVGTGSGYQAAILSYMGMRVFSIERNEKIYLRTQKLIDSLGIRLVLRCSDGTIGWEEFAPFDGIIVTAGSPVVPNNLKRQLNINGKLVIPVGDKSSQALNIVTKTGENDFEIEKVPNFVFVPLIGREGWKEES